MKTSTLEFTPAQTQTLQKQIADILGWKIDEVATYGQQFKVARPEGGALCFSAALRANQWVIRGEFPRLGNDLFMPQSPQTINVGKGRPASDIVNEIRRRLLPWYEGEYEAAEQRKDAWVAAQNLRETTATRLLTALGYEHIDRVSGEKTHYTPYCHGVDKLTIKGEGKASIETENCSVECLLEIFEVLKRHRGA